MVVARASLGLQVVIVVLLAAILVKPADSAPSLDITQVEAQLQLIADQIGGDVTSGPVEGTTVRTDDLFSVLSRICYAVQHPDTPVPLGGFYASYSTCEGS